MELETKFTRFDTGVATLNGTKIEGYASRFGAADQSGDVVKRGAFGKSLDEIHSGQRTVKMLWQHDPTQPIGVWDEVRVDEQGLYVRGRLLDSVPKGREAKELVTAGAIDGLSIGYRTLKASKINKSQRLLTELELWEVSLVTFPMLSSARVASKAIAPEEDRLCELARVLEEARLNLAGG